jgi:hypothetical protein
MRSVFFFALFIVMLTRLASAEGWNNVREHKKILKTLKVENSQFECGAKCVHKVIGEYSVGLTTGNNRLVVTSSSDPVNDCHACAPQLSFFSFLEIDQKWVRTWSQIAALKRGAWGEFLGKQIMVHAIAPDHYGIFIETSFTGQGYSNSHLEIYYPPQPRLKKILVVCIAADSSGAFEKTDKEYFEWEANYKVQPVDGEFADIEFNMVNKVTGERFQSHFTFDDIRYRSRDSDIRMIGEDCGTDDDY